MEEFDFSKFDEMFDIEGLASDLKKYEEEGGSREYKEVPVGTYVVKVEKMELTESKKGLPMLSIWFKILEGDYEKSLLFYNQVITQDFQLHLAKEMLRSLSDGGREVEFENFKQFGQLIMDIHEDIDGFLEYVLKYSEKKGYPVFEITEVFEVDE